MPVPFATFQNFTRYAAGSYSSGTYTAGATSTVSVKCVIQPYQDNAQVLMPREGGRWLDGFIAIDSESELNTDSALTYGDRVTYEGATYEVIRSNSWPFLSISHWECYAQRIDPNTN